MNEDKERAIAFYTVLIFGVGAIVTIDTTYQTSAPIMLIQSFLFTVIMYVAIKIPLFRSNLVKLKITHKPKVKHRFELSKDNQLSLYIYNPPLAKDTNVLYQFKKFSDYQGTKYEKKYPQDLELLNHRNDGTSNVLFFDTLTHNDTREVKIGIYQNGKLALFFGNALLTGFRDGTFEYIISCTGEYLNEKFVKPDFSVWLTIKDGVIIKMAKEL